MNYDIEDNSEDDFR